MQLGFTVLYYDHTGIVLPIVESILYHVKARMPPPLNPINLHDVYN